MKMQGRRGCEPCIFHTTAGQGFVILFIQDTHTLYKATGHTGGIPAASEPAKPNHATLGEEREVARLTAFKPFADVRTASQMNGSLERPAANPTADWATQSANGTHGHRTDSHSDGRGHI